MNSPSVLLLSIVFATIDGGANATQVRNMSADAGTGSLENGEDAVLLQFRNVVSAKEKLMTKWKLGLAGPESWGSMIGSMDGVKHTLYGHDEVTLDVFKQFVGIHSVKSQPTTIPVDGGAK